jgi:hypothetical protein
VEKRRIFVNVFKIATLMFVINKDFKLKPAVLIIACLSFIFMNGYSQNRINEWDIEKITSIQVESKANNGKVEMIEFERISVIDTLINFLKLVDFKTVEDITFDKNKVLNHWIYKLTFQGQHDQILFCKDYATIGKTIFSIDKRVVKDLKKIIADCKKINQIKG